MSIIMEVQRWLKERMDENLYNHSVAVSELAVDIARRYGADEQKARLAGLIHDCGKTYSSKELMDFAKIFELKISDIERNNPLILHSYIGPIIFEQIFGKLLNQVKQAVERHTTADDKMTLLDKVIYVADSLEPNRHYPGLIHIREKMRLDLDYTFYLVLQRKIQLTMETRKQIHPRSFAAWNWIIPLLKNKRI